MSLVLLQRLNPECSDSWYCQLRWSHLPVPAGTVSSQDISRVCVPHLTNKVVSAFPGSIYLTVKASVKESAFLFCLILKLYPLATGFCFCYSIKATLLEDTSVLHKSRDLFVVHYLGLCDEFDRIDSLSFPTSLPHLQPLPVSVKLYLPLVLITFHFSDSPAAVPIVPLLNWFFVLLSLAHSIIMTLVDIAIPLILKYVSYVSVYICILFQQKVTYSIATCRKAYLKCLHLPASSLTHTPVLYLQEPMGYSPWNS